MVSVLLLFVAGVLRYKSSSSSSSSSPLPNADSKRAGLPAPKATVLFGAVLGGDVEEADEKEEDSPKSMR